MTVVSQKNATINIVVKVTLNEFGGDRTINKGEGLKTRSIIQDKEKNKGPATGLEYKIYILARFAKSGIIQSANLLGKEGIIKDKVQFNKLMSTL